jgi:hypothetical protein
MKAHRLTLLFASILSTVPFATAACGAVTTSETSPRPQPVPPEPVPPFDASAPDGGPDAAPDGGPDAAPDGGPDAAPDGGPDAAPDGGPDASPCADLVPWDLPNSCGTTCMEVPADAGGAADGGINCSELCLTPVDPDAGMSCEVNRDGGLVLCIYCGTGRRPEGFDAKSLRSVPAAAGEFFREAARLEAASVHAFRALRADLCRLGAPKRLRKAAARAKRDEVRHTRSTAALARRFGSAPAIPSVAPLGSRSLVSIALENAVEGCVRETHGALVAHFQATHAADPTVRATLSRIARDETQHAALSWEAHRFFYARLTRAERARVDDAMRATVRELLVAEGAVSAELGRLAGLPSAETRRNLVLQLSERLWGAGATSPHA